MTKAKRYEGEKLRSARWYNSMRDKAWAAQRKGEQEIRPIVAGKFNLYTEVYYNEEECLHYVKTEIGPRGPMGILPPLTILLIHSEPYDEFPSDHLKTKLLLIAG